MKINTKVLILESPVNYAHMREGVYLGKYKHGYRVRVLNDKSEEIVVWADKVREIK